ncbi:DUF7010 family protein [Deinococcus marmoris]|uniref:Uncharacterized protein n=1 Tax=Deinococcus marmoris TaxID=249408 RepID=A0A1U7P1V9_9DEIO|nr:hypothetical protein [Deinococcus marmoris]OLV19153.1 hypothetical protein BOO71_0003535 [Deinococcus marmoris]
MISAIDYLNALTTVNRHGFGFLLAYGLTWLVAALIWRTQGDRAGAYAALFQGMVALPLAFGLTALTAVGTRPEDPTMNMLSTYLATGQLMVLPLVIVLVMGRRYTLSAAILAATTAVHFLPYTWLYQTPIYLVMAVLLAIVIAMLIRLEDRRQQSSGALICAASGIILSLGAVAAFVVS